MSISDKIVLAFWKGVGASDTMRLSKQTYPDDLVEVRDIAYLKDGHKYHLLDVYYPKNSDGKKLPVIIDIHGGGWFYGDKELNKNYCLHLAQRGFVVFNISYRLAPEVCVDEQVQDCAAALKHIGKIMKDYPCDRKKVFLTGDSAGGQLAAVMAAVNCSKKIRKAYGTEDPGLDIKAVALTSPVAYLKPKGLMGLYMCRVVGKKYRRKSFAKYVNLDKILKECKDYPPTVLFTSLMDVVARGQTKRAYKDLRKMGVKTKLYMSYNPTLNHVYAVLDPEAGASVKAINNMTKFFKKVS